MSHYHDSDDRKLLREFKHLAPTEFKGFLELDAIVDGSLSIDEISYNIGFEVARRLGST